MKPIKIKKIPEEINCPMKLIEEKIKGGSLKQGIKIEVKPKAKTNV